MCKRLEERVHHRSIVAVVMEDSQHAKSTSYWMQVVWKSFPKLFTMLKDWGVHGCGLGNSWAKLTVVNMFQNFVMMDHHTERMPLPFRGCQRVSGKFRATRIQAVLTWTRGEVLA